MRGTWLYFVIGMLIVILLVVSVRGFVDVVYNCNSAMENAQREREQEQRRSDNYAKAIELLQGGDYLEARKLLDYLWDYKDGEVLLAYARARINFQRTDYFAYSVYDCLDKIPEDYSGDLADDIAAFRVEAEKRRPELQALYDAEPDQKSYDNCLHLLSGEVVDTCVKYRCQNIHDDIGCHKPVVL